MAVKKKSLKRLLRNLSASAQVIAKELQPRIEAVRSYYYSSPTNLSGILTRLEKKTSAKKVSKKAKKASERTKKITITIG